MARYCRECGAALAENSTFCVACGAAAGTEGIDAAASGSTGNTYGEAPIEYLDSHEKEGGYTQQNTYGSYTPPPYTANPSSNANGQQAAQAAAPHPDSPYAPVGIGAFLGTQLLLCIPVVNLIVMIVWACGGCRKINLRNFARAWLIWVAIGFVLSIVLFILLGAAISQYLYEFSDMMDMLNYI